MMLRTYMLAALAAAIERVRRFDTPADVGLRAFFRTQPGLGQSDRAFVADGTFAVLRRMRSLAAVAGSDEPRHLALAMLVRDQGRSLRDLEPIVERSEATWLRELKARLAQPLEPAVAHDLPDWLWERLGRAFPDDERAALARALLVPAPVDLRDQPVTDRSRGGTRSAARRGIRSGGNAVFAAGHTTGRPAVAHHLSRGSRTGGSRCRTKAAS